MTYNPFKNPFDILTADDLGSLINNEITEGYWIEYKSEFQPSKKISKSIASFANTYGGWYFIGVKADKTKNTATDICGFKLAEIPDPIDKLRESIKANIDPVPVFHSKLIEIGSGKAVLVVQIPENQETPFITKEGRIYRRVSDSSDPVPEDNRYAIDRLVDNGRELAKRFAEFCIDERTFSEAEEHQSWVNIFLSPYPLGIIERDDMLSSEGIEKLIHLSQIPIKIYLNTTKEIGTGNLPFNAGQLGVGSVILKQADPSKMAFNSLSVEFFMDGRAKLFIPLKYMQGLHNVNINNFKSPEVRQALTTIVKSDEQYDSALIRFFDIQALWTTVTILLNFYQEWYGKALEQNSLRAAITIGNTWRSSPFCDADEWGIYVQKFGLPVQNTDFIRIPNQKGKGLIAKFPLWTMICPFIGMGFGLPIDLYSNIVFSDTNAKTDESYQT